MAITGTGTSSDPYIVHTWEEFQSLNNSDHSNDYVKFYNPHEENGSIVLSGNGTASNPYIVSTYEELLFVTGTSNVLSIPYDEQSELYIYNGIYCRYDYALSTIDFNNINPSGYTSSFDIHPKIYGNGWTWLNIYIKSCPYNDAINFKSYVESLNILNVFVQRGVGYNQHQAIFNFISVASLLKISVYNNSEDNNLMAMYGSRTGNSYFNDSSIYVAGRIKSLVVGNSSYSGYCGNTHITLNLSNVSSVSLNNCINVLFDGRIDAVDSISNFTTYVTNCIFNFNCNQDLSSTYSFNSLCLYNSDRINVTSSDTNFVGVTTAQLKDVDYLNSMGFPILEVNI
jgi:hypothetical protein